MRERALAAGLTRRARSVCRQYAHTGPKAATFVRDYKRKEGTVQRRNDAVEEAYAVNV